MSAKDTLRRNKTAIHETLCGDYRLILNKVHERNLITAREYNNLKSINKEDVEGHVVELVDKIMNKGEDLCQDFLNLLQTDKEIETTYPELKNIQLNDTFLLRQPIQAFSRDNNGALTYIVWYGRLMFGGVILFHSDFLTCPVTREQEAKEGEVFT